LVGISAAAAFFCRAEILPLKQIDDTYRGGFSATVASCFYEICRGHQQAVSPWSKTEREGNDLSADYSRLQIN